MDDRPIIKDLFSHDMVKKPRPDRVQTNTSSFFFFFHSILFERIYFRGDSELEELEQEETICRYENMIASFGSWYIHMENRLFRVELLGQEMIEKRFDVIN